jgi:hypothetical protein
VPDTDRDQAPWRCLFCRMRTGVRLFRIPVCAICRDQLQDFVWVSLVLMALVPTGFISGTQFVVEEVPSLPEGSSAPFFRSGGSPGGGPLARANAQGLECSSTRTLRVGIQRDTNFSRPNPCVSEGLQPEVGGSSPVRPARVPDSTMLF